MKFLDLFAGIGGFRLGMEQNGHEAVGWVEWDKFARASYEAIHDVEDEWTAKDITEVTEEEIKSIGEVDVITGGFPCQSFSVAGHRKGFEDTRGTLFFDIIRFAKVLKPKALFLENVKGLVNHDKGNTLDIMVKTLNDIGYRVDFEVLNSKHFGVPQNRERIFIIAVREDLVEQEDWVYNGTTVVPKGKERISGYEDTKMFNFGFPKNNTVETMLVDILEDEIDEKFYLSRENTEELIWSRKPKTDPSIVASISRNKDNPKSREVNLPKQQHLEANQSGTSNTLSSVQKDNWVFEGMPIREATKKGYTVAEEGDAINFQFPDSKTRRGRVGKGIANTLEASAINQGILATDQKIINNIVEEQKILKIKSQELLDERGALPNMYNVYNMAEVKDVAPSQTTMSSRVVASPAVIIKQNYRIRKLTPRECFRLQAYPDDTFEKAKAVNSNSQLYKQAGNSVTVNVIDAIAKELTKLLGQ